MKTITLTLASLILAASASAHAANAAVTARQHITAHCQTLTEPCTGVIARALTDAAKAGKISAKCAAGRPPMPPMALDIALWLVGHHDLDDKPIADASVIIAERLWPCSRVQ
jgi:hypothetical protein